MKNRASGFTLMEVIITTILVGVIATLALVTYGGVIEKQRAKEAEQLLHMIFNNVQGIKIETGSIANVIVGGQDPFLVDMNDRPSLNFTAPIVSIAAGPTLTYTITRRAPLSYTFTMVIVSTTTTPVITCSGGPAGLCAQLGY